MTYPCQKAWAAWKQCTSPFLEKFLVEFLKVLELALSAFPLICVTVNSPTKESPRHLRKWTWRGPQETACSRICYLSFSGSWHQRPTYSSPLNLQILTQGSAHNASCFLQLVNKALNRTASQAIFSGFAHWLCFAEPLFIFALLLWILSNSMWSPPLLKHDTQSCMWYCDFASAK